MSIVLTALFPGAFLRDHAQWTYQSDEGRVDVALVGNTQNGQIDVHGQDLRLERPRWFLDSKGNQGVVVHFAVSYLKKAHQMTLRTRGNAKERDISLVMNFRGQDLRVDNRRKSAYVRFENIRVNGKEVASEKTVWHDKPFKYRLEELPDNADVILSFDVRKPIFFSDIRCDRVVGLFVLCLLLVLLLYDIIKGLVQSITEQKGVMLSDVGKTLRFHKRKVLISVLLTVLVNILCIPLWTELGYVSSVRTLFNKEAGIALLYESKTSGAAPFYLQSTPQPLNDPSPFFVPQTNFQQANLNFRARREWQKISLKLQSQRNGTIILRLKGAEVRDEYGHFYSVLTDWRNLKINGTVFFDENKALSFQKCFSMQIPVKGNETLHIEAEFRRHHFTARDFTFLKSGAYSAT